MKSMLSMAVVLGAVSGTVGSAAAQDIEWDNASGGVWHDATNWNPMTIPLSSGQVAVVGLPGTYTVGIGAGISPQISGLRLTNPNATVAIANGRDLFLNGPDVVINGTVLVNETGSTSATRLLIGEPDLLITGSGQIVLNDSSSTAAGRAQLIDLIGGRSTTLGPDMTLRGSGQVNLVLTNDGTIRADAAGRELAIIGPNKNNNGLMEAVGGGLLRLATVVDQGTTGRMVADGGEIRLISTVVGGEIDSSAGLFEIRAGSSALTDVALVTGDIEIENGRDLFIRGGLTMDGTFIVNREGSTSATRLLLGTSGTLDGNMTVFLNDTSSTATGRAQLIDAVGDLTTTLAETVTVRGSGQINANIINNGTIIADADGLELAIIGTPKTNNNLIQVDGGGKLRLQSQLNQGPDGLIEVVDGEVRLISTIVGGEIDTTGGLFEIAGGLGTLTDVALVTGDIEIENGRDLFVRGNLTLDGTIVINRDASISATRLLAGTSGVIDGDGEIFLQDTATTTTVGRALFIHAIGGLTTTLGPDISLTGNGNVNGNYVIQGRMAPGKIGTVFGETAFLRHTGTLEMSDSTVVEIQIGGRADGEFDRIDGVAAITVDGTLDASLIDGFEADTCENFVIITGLSVTGEFDTFIPPAPTSNQRWRLFYTGTSVELRATCTADIDGDCTLTIFDFLAFQNLFDMGSSEADFDGDGTLTLFDFLAFQNAFSRGCD